MKIAVLVHAPFICVSPECAVERRKTMKSSHYSKLFAVAVVISAFSAFGATTPAPAAKPAPAAAKSHGMKFHGSIVSVDTKAKSVQVKDAAGKTTEFVWNEATKAPKAPLTAGENVSVHYMTKDGKNVATVITVTPAQSASHTATKTTTKSTTKAKS
jgi:hypothetical protein